MKNYKQNGNVLIYILLAIALMAALTFAISGEDRGQQVNQLSNAQVNLIAGQIITHATNLRLAANQMNRFGIDYDQILTLRPTIVGYENDTNRQIYHPKGGGVSVFPFESEKHLCRSDCTDFNRGWKMPVKQTEWIPGKDNFFITYMDIAPNICAKLNQKLNGESVIYEFTGILSAEFMPFSPDFSSEILFEIAECPDCVDKPMACVGNGFTNTFYMIAASF